MASFNPAMNFGVAGQVQDDPFQVLSQKQPQELSASQLSANDLMAFNTSSYHHPALVQTSNQVLSHQQSADGSVGTMQYQAGASVLGHSSIPGSPYAHPANLGSTSGQATIATSASPSTIH